MGSIPRTSILSQENSPLENASTVTKLRNRMEEKCNISYAAGIGLNLNNHCLEQYLLNLKTQIAISFNG